MFNQRLEIAQQALSQAEAAKFTARKQTAECD